MKSIKRSPEMILAGYYLARCGQRDSAGPAKPPVALNAVSWQDAYDLFYDILGDGRTPQQFRNSMKNVRDTFDVVFDSGRIGWVDKNTDSTELPRNLDELHHRWIDRTDFDLENAALALLSSTFLQSLSSERPEAKTEGGERVVVSLKRERNESLRKAAIAKHGLDCMACGFNFEAFYGEYGNGFVEVHHVVPLSESGRTETIPESDLIVLCANCHRMVHRKKGICLSLDELEEKIRSQSDKP